MTGEEFRQIRRALGLTQHQMAAILSYRSHVRISEIERGHLAIPDRVAMLMDAMRAGYRPDIFPRENAK